MKQGFLYCMSAWMISHPKRTATLALFFAFLMMAGVVHVQYFGDLDATLPESSHLTRDIRATRALFGSNDTIVAVIEGGSFTERVRISCALAKKLTLDPAVLPNSVLGVGARSTRTVLNQDDALLVEGADVVCNDVVDSKTIVNGLGPQADFLVGNNNTLVLYADINIENGAYLPIRDRSAIYVNEIRNQMSAPAVTVTITGQPMFMSAMQLFSQRIAWLLPIVVVIIGLLHYEALRSVQSAIIPAVTGILATVMAVGLMGWLSLPMDEYSATAPILILAVAAGHSIQLLKRYMEECACRAHNGHLTESEHRLALIVTLRTMAPVLTIAVVAASLCLFSLIALDIRAVGRFGFVSGFGIIFALFIELTLIPAYRSLYPQKHIKDNHGVVSAHWHRLLTQVGNLVVNARLCHLLIALSVLLLVGILALGTLRISASILEPFSPTISERIAVDRLEQSGIGTFPLDIVIDAGSAGSIFNPKYLSLAAEIGRHLRQVSNIGAVASPQTMLEFLRCRFVGSDRCASLQPMTQAEASQLWIMFSGSNEAYPLIDHDQRYLRMRAFVKNDNSEFIKPIEAAIRKLADQRNVVVSIGGPAIMAKALGDGIFSAMHKKIFLIMVVAGAVGAVIFRSIVAAILFVIPSALSALVSYIFLSLTNTTLNVATVSIAAIAVGIGIDYLVYFTFRLRELLTTGLDWNSAIQIALHTAGAASLCVAAAVAGGYAVLNLSWDFMPHRWLGQIMPLSVIAGLAGTLIIYPVMLTILRPKFLRIVNAPLH